MVLERGKTVAGTLTLNSAGTLMKAEQQQQWAQANLLKRVNSRKVA